MDTKVEGEVDLKFVAVGVSKKGRPYLRVSNGLETKFMGTDVPPDDYSESGINEGDDFRAVVSVDCFDPFKTKVVQLVE